MLVKIEELTKNKILDKILATALIISLTFSNVFLLCTFFTNGLISFATGINLESQGIKTNNKNVEFDAYFNIEGNNVHKALININADNLIHFYVRLKESGYLKNATIEIINNENEEELNYQITDNIGESVSVQNIEANKIYLNQINNNQEIYLDLPISIKLENQVNINKLNQDSKVIFKAIYIDEKTKEHNIEKEVVLNTGLTGNFENKIETEIVKYIPYNLSENKGIILQKKITSKIINDTNMSLLPIKENNIIEKVPSFNNIYPTSVSVIANKLEITKEQDGAEILFNETNYTYNKEEQLITIKINNSQNETVNLPKGEDELLVTYIYGQEAFESITQENIITNSTENKMLIYDNEGITELTNKVENETIVTEAQGQIASFEIENKTEKVSKNKMYANYNTDVGKYNTEYNTMWKINVSNKDLIDNLKIEEKEEVFIDKNNNQNSLEIAGIDYSVYSETKLNKINIEKILGQEWFIRIYDKANNIITELTNEIEADENNNIVVTYGEKPGKIIIETSSPVAEGNILIEHKKEIKKELLYSKEQIQNFENLTSTILGSIKFKNNTEYTSIEENISKMSLENTVTNAELIINQTDFTTTAIHENIEFNIKFNNNMINSDVYEKPIFEIELPEYIEDITIKQSNILFDNELSIDNIEKQIVDGKIRLKVIVNGKQTELEKNELSGGTNIVLNTDIKLKFLTSAITQDIKFKYTNMSATSYKNTVIEDEKEFGYFSLPINFITDKNILNITKLYGFNNKEEIYSIEENTIGKLTPKSNKTEITNEIIVVNNYKEELENLKILGRTFFKDNKNILNSENLGSNINFELSNYISAIEGIENENITIYYSENETATTDLNIIENGWTNNLDLNKIKSYMIVTNNYNIPIGQILKFAYTISIPENLDYNNKAYTNFATYFNTQNEVETKVVESKKIGLATIDNTKLSINIKPLLEEGEVIKEGQILTIEANVQNTSTVDAEDVNIQIEAPEKTKHIDIKENGSYQEKEEKEKEIELGTLKSGESKTETYSLKVKDMEELNDKIATMATVTASNSTEVVRSNVATVEGEQTPLEVKYYFFAPDDVYEVGTSKRIILIVKNTSDKELTNTSAKVNLSRELEVTNTKFVDGDGTNNDIVKDGNGLKISFNNLQPSEKNLIEFWVKVKIQGTSFSTYSTVVADGIKEYKTETITGQIKNVKLNITQLSPSKEYVKEDEEFEYRFKIENVGNNNANDVNIEVMLPEDINYINVNITGNKSSYYPITVKDIHMIIKVNIEAGDVIYVNIQVKAKRLAKEETQKETTNIARLKANGMNDKESNAVKVVILDDPNIKPTTPTSKPETPTKPVIQTPETPEIANNIDTYKISGNVWEDINKNATRDNEEKLLNDIEVMLIKESGAIVTTSSGKKQSTFTNSNGFYEFNNVIAGRYMVIFLYDYNKYDVTEYKKQGIDSNYNSDGTTIESTLNGKKQILASTDVIQVQNNNIENIDLGLIENLKFDLSLQKYATKVVIQNAEETKVYNFDKKELVKVDLPQKKIVETTATIEYEIIVKNEGHIAGYVKKIVDYLPKDLTFLSDLNPNWYLDPNGNLYNEELVQALITPGQTKTIKLILSKKMTSNNLGTISNIAEIAEDYNEQGTKDSNSTPNNKIQNENDTGIANVMITVKTGGAVLSIIVILVFLGILVIITIILKRKILR